MKGIILINKDKQMTSHDVVAILRKKLNIKRIGHTGTLDPNVTGVLPICIGNATRLSQYIMEQGKVYEGTMEFGKQTDSFDADGQVIKESDLTNFSREEIETAFKNFIGTIKQKPPIYSAIKVKGKRLYKYARNEEAVDIPYKEVIIYDLQVLEFVGSSVKFRVHCSKGTYIRSLVNDIGIFLNTFAYMTSLVRTKVGQFYIDDSVTLNQLVMMDLNDIKSFIIEPDKALYNLAAIFIYENIAHRLENGQRVNIDTIDHKIEKNHLNLLDENNIKVYVNDTFIGIGSIKENILKMERVLNRD